MTVQCNLTSYEATIFFESVSTTDANYEDDFWFAGYCLATSFTPTNNNRYFLDDPDFIAEYELEQELISSCSYLRNYYQSTVHLYNDLFIHSIDPQVGF